MGTCFPNSVGEGEPIFLTLLVRLVRDRMQAWHPPVGSNNTQFPPLWAPQRHPGYSLPYCTDTDTALPTVQIQIQLSLQYRYRYSSPYLQARIQLSLLTYAHTAIPTHIYLQIPQSLLKKIGKDTVIPTYRHRYSPLCLQIQTRGLP